MIGQTISHYTITAKLGEGGMGEVYLATDTNLDRKVAIKFLSADRAADPDARQRFLHEAKAQAMLSHANIATFLDVGESDGHAFLVMEYVEGKPLSQIAKDEKQSLPEILDLVIQVAEGLQAAHEHGIVHRDIKPENILITSKHQVKITDFGLAKWKGATTLTKDGTRMGTAYYMSPEQAEGKRVDPRSDIFSLGVILYELVCRQRPFEGETESAILYDLISSHPQPLARFCRDIPEELQRIVNKCLAKNPDERYQSAADLAADLKHLRRELDGLQHTRAFEVGPTRSKRSLLKYVVPASVVLLLALIVLILKPFKFEVAPDQKATASENTLAVMYFNNLADADDKDKTAQMVTSLLITGLSESQYLQVVSRQRLHDILRQMGKEGPASIDKNTATDVAAKAGVRWMITGDLLQSQPRIVLACEVSDVQSGRVVATQRISGEEGEDLFAVTDKLSRAICNHLSLPDQSKGEQTRLLADVTTHSPEAYRYFLEGFDLHQKLYFEEALVSFQKAVAIDSTFATAYWLMALVTPNETQSAEAIAKAAKYSDRATWKEQHYIKGAEAFLRNDRVGALRAHERIVERYPQEILAWKNIGAIYRDLQQPRKALEAFNQALALDSLDKWSYNWLAYGYSEIGDIDKSIEAINKYIALAPDEANPYDTRGDLYAMNGRLDEAIASYKKAISLKSDFGSNDKLAWMYIYKREFARADSVSRAMAASTSQKMRSQGRYCLALSLIYRGRFADGLGMLDQGIVADRLEQCDGEAYVAKLSLKVHCYQGLGQIDSAIVELGLVRRTKRPLMPNDINDGRGWQVELLAENGEVATAESVVVALRADIERADTTLRYLYWYAEGCIAFARGEAETAIRELERAATGRRWFWIRYMLGRAYLMAGRPDLAITEFERALKADFERIHEPYKSVRCLYYLGQAYEQSGWKERAIEQYETFLEIWKDADPGIKEIDDAKARLAKLSSGRGSST